MNTKACFIVFGLVFSFFLMSEIYAESSIQSNVSNQSVTLDIENMSCAMCKFTIKKAMNAVDGVQKVSVDYDSKTATVIFDPQKTNIESLIKATTHAGYPSTIRHSQ